VVYLIIQPVSEDYKESNDVMIVTDELEQCKEAVVVQSKVLCQHLPGEVEKTIKSTVRTVSVLANKNSPRYKLQALPLAQQDCNVTK
jgi:hypothetical protein